MYIIVESYGRHLLWPCLLITTFLSTISVGSVSINSVPIYPDSPLSPFDTFSTESSIVIPADTVANLGFQTDVNNHSNDYFGITDKIFSPLLTIALVFPGLLLAVIALAISQEGILFWQVLEQPFLRIQSFRIDLWQLLLSCFGASLLLLTGSFMSLVFEIDVPILHSITIYFNILSFLIISTWMVYSLINILHSNLKKSLVRQPGLQGPKQKI